MPHPALAFPLVIATIVVVVGLDLLLFRSRTWFWERLVANIGVVLVFVAL
jgi:hypothetical protein